MKKSEYLKTLKFNGFECYPPQQTAIYLKCEGVDKKTRKNVCKFIRVNLFNAVTFNPEEVKKILNNENVDWEFHWLPADEIDEVYDKGDID